MSARRRMQFLIVLALMFAGALAEMFTLGAIVPFLGLLVNPDLLNQSGVANIFLSELAKWMGTSSLVAASLIFVMFAAAAAGIRLLLSWFSLRFVFAVGADFGESVYRNTLLQPYTYHIQRNSSQTLATIEKVTALVMGIMTPAMHLLIAIVMVVALLSAMLYVDYATSLIAAALFGSMYFCISAWAKNKLKQNSQIISDNGSVRVKAIQEGLGGIRDVIIDGTYKVYVDQFAKADRAQRLAQANNAVLASSPKYVVESAGMILIVGLAYFLTNKYGAEQSIPVLGALAIGAQRLLPYMQTIYNSIAGIRGNAASGQDALNMLKLKTDHYNKTNEEIVKSRKDGPAIALNEVSYAYPNSSTKTLRNINLTIHPGEKIGFVGKTGSGKSTLIDIIMGLLPHNEGTIQVWGENLSNKNIRSWQHRIAHVPQAIFLSDTTIAENVAFGTPKDQIDLTRVQKALQQAELLEFVSNLPNGLNTRVGERGVQLSGGQRQRIGIARALYKEADVLVLDEATSALDVETESRVMASINELNPNLIILMIAHRLGTLNTCTRIIEISSGEALEKSATDFKINKP